MLVHLSINVESLKFQDHPNILQMDDEEHRFRYYQSYHEYLTLSKQKACLHNAEHKNCIQVSAKYVHREMQSNVVALKRAVVAFTYE